MLLCISFCGGFTLAEVLITLAIIGIIATLTIPSLVANVQQQQYITKYKKIYSTFAQAETSIINEYGPIDTLCTPTGWTVDTNCIMDKFAEKLSVVKKCSGNTAYTNGCWHWLNSGPEINPLYSMNGTVNFLWGNSYPGLILSDGTLVHFFGGRAACDNSFECVTVAVDVNAFSSPNTIGKDVFFLEIHKNSISPYGTITDCDPVTPSGFGYGCSVKYLTQ